MRAFALVHRPPHPRSDGVPQILQLITGDGAKEHTIQMATELAALNAGAFGAVPLEIAGDEELERYSGETVFVRVVNRDGIWFLGGATFDQPSHTPITGVAHSQRVELTILRGDEIGIT